MARAGQSATLLADGRVLLAGGIGTPNATTTLVTAGLYDPQTGLIVATGELTTPRERHTATLLADGRVLLAGGHDFHDGVTTNLRSAELYDPITQTFKATAMMTVARNGQTATLLHDGRVLIAGGANADDAAVASAELFDPKTGTFSAAGSMSTPRFDAAATLLADGQVLSTGGATTPTATGMPLATAELYDPVTGRFSLTGPMTTARVQQTATLLADGRVVVIGGYGNVAPVPWAELYDPATGRFSLSGTMSVPRFGHASSLLSDGRVLVLGGERSLNDTVDPSLESAELFDPNTGAFSPTGQMAQSRYLPTATRLANGSVLVVGGFNETAAGVQRAVPVELYDPHKGTFTPTATSTSALVPHHGPGT